LPTNVTRIRTLQKSRGVLNGVDDCPLPSQMSEPRKANIQVLQSKDFIEVKVQAYLIRVQKRLFRCGMFSHTSEVLDGRQDVLYEIGTAGCADLHRELQFEYQGMTISDLKPNATTTTPDMTLVGKLGVDGSCVGAPS